MRVFTVFLWSYRSESPSYNTELCITRFLRNRLISDHRRYKGLHQVVPLVHQHLIWDLSGEEKGNNEVVKTNYVTKWTKLEENGTLEKHPSKLINI